MYYFVDIVWSTSKHNIQQNMVILRIPVYEFNEYACMYH